MKAILLAGGHRTRLAPLTTIYNKHLLPLYRKDTGTPMIEFGIRALKEAGIKDVAIVLGDKHCEQVFAYLKDGSQYDMRFTYYFQGEPLGIAHAIACAWPHVDKEEHFVAYLGDNYYSNGIREFIGRCAHRPEILQGLLFAHVENAQMFGSPIFSNNQETLLKIIEKPRKPQQPLAVTGCYYFNSTYYSVTFASLQPSERGEYEISDLINKILLHNRKLTYYDFYKGEWGDMGTFKNIKKVEKLLGT